MAQNTDTAVQDVPHTSTHTSVQQHFSLSLEPTSVEADADLNAHMAVLGFDTIEDYRFWCVTYGFSDLLDKSLRQRQREVRVAGWIRDNEAVGPPHITPDDIRALFSDGDGTDEGASDELQIIRSAIRTIENDLPARDALKQLLLHLAEHHRDLLSAATAIIRMGPRKGNTFIEGVISLAEFHGDWRRKIRDWEPDEEEAENTRLKFTSLARHLLTKFHVPIFMDAAWFQGPTREARRYQEWFLHMGIGLSLDACARPPRLTRRGLHIFRDAPSPYLIEEALRWGYVRALGGTPEVARAVIDSPLGLKMKHESFWRTVILFILRHRELDLSCLEPLIDYIYHQRFLPEAPQPGLCMKKRSMEKLLRGTAAWHMHMPEDDRRSGTLVRWRLNEETSRWQPRRTQANAILQPWHLTAHLEALGLESTGDYFVWCREHGFTDTIHKSWQEKVEEVNLAKSHREEAARMEDLNRHMESLGLDSVETYRSWCRAHAFSDRLEKNRRQQRRERRHAEWLRSRESLTAARQQSRRLLDTITDIHEGRLDADDLQLIYLRRIAAGFAAIESDPDRSQALFCLLRAVVSCDGMFDLDPVIPVLGPRPGNTYLDALMAVAAHHNDWLRPVEAWTPESHNTGRQFSTLVRHLFAKYEVPAFMDSAWFREDEEIAEHQQTWFKHIGGGGNIRTADIPVHLTKMMAHRFLEAPDHYLIEEALRWGQILGWDGEIPLVEAILKTRIGRSFTNEEFWSTVIQYLAYSPMLDPEFAGPIIDYIHHQKYVPQETVHPGGEIEQGPPPHPDYHMRRRSHHKLLGQVTVWLQEQEAAAGHEQQESGKKRVKSGWKPSGIGEFTYEEKDHRTEKTLHWTIRELLSNRELAVEGHEMHHCVASYSPRCQRGGVSVWSLQVQSGKSSPMRIMTIAVENRRRVIIQSRGKYNAHPLGESPGEVRWKNLKKNEAIYLQQSPRIVGMWMTQEHLT